MDNKLILPVKYMLLGESASFVKGIVCHCYNLDKCTQEVHIFPPIHFWHIASITKGNEFDSLGPSVAYIICMSVGVCEFE